MNYYIPGIIVSAGTQSARTSSLIFANSNGVTFGLSGSSQITASAAAGGGGITAINVSACTTSNNLTAITFANSNGLTFGLNASTITASYTVPTVTNSSWTVSDAATSVTISRLAFTNSNGLTLALSTGAGAATVTGSYTVPTVTAGSDTMGMSNLGNTAGTTGVVSGDSIRYLLAGGNNITLSQSLDAGNRSATLTISAPNQSVQTQNFVALSATNTLYTSGTVLLTGSNMITVKSSAAGQTVIIDATQSIQTQGITGDQLSVGASTGGNTAGNTTVNSGSRLVFVGSNGITVSQGTAAGATTLTLSGVTTAAQTNQSAIKGFGVSNTGNTAGNTGLSTGIDWVMAGTNGITASQSTAAGGPNTVWISGITQSNQSAIKALGVSNTGNTAGNTGVSTGIDWVIAGSNGITASESTAAGGPNTVWLSGTTYPAQATLSYWENHPVGLVASQSLQHTGSTQYVFPFQLPVHVSCSYVRFLVSGAAQSTTYTTSPTNTTYSGQRFMTYNMVIYSQGVGASSRSLQNYTSGSIGATQSNKISIGAVASQYTFTLQYSGPSEAGATAQLMNFNPNFSNASIQGSTASHSNLTGFRYLDIPLVTLMTPGNYWMALGLSSTTSTQATSDLVNWGMQPFTTLGNSQNTLVFALFGSASSSSNQPQYAVGSWTTNAIGTTGSIAMGSVSSNASHVRPYFQLVRQV